MAAKIEKTTQLYEGKARKFIIPPTKTATSYPIRMTLPHSTV